MGQAIYDPANPYGNSDSLGSGGHSTLTREPDWMSELPHPGAARWASMPA
jgi:hypothetical protein